MITLPIALLEMAGLLLFDCSKTHHNYYFASLCGFFLTFVAMVILLLPLPPDGVVVSTK